MPFSTPTATGSLAYTRPAIAECGNVISLMRFSGPRNETPRNPPHGQAQGISRAGPFGYLRGASMPPRAFSKLAETNSQLSASGQLLSAPPSSDFLSARVKPLTLRQQVHSP